jgi:hypothetical protein
MKSCTRALSIALTFVVVEVTVVSAVSTVAHADKIKTPPPKDASQKGQDCAANTKAKTADKAFCAMNDYVRGRVVNPKTKNTDKAQPAERKLGL